MLYAIQLNMFLSKIISLLCDFKCHSFNFMNFLYVCKHTYKMALYSIIHHCTMIYVTKASVFGHLSCFRFFYYNIKCCDEHLYTYIFVQLVLKMNCRSIVVMSRAYNSLRFLINIEIFFAEFLPIYIPVSI